MKTIHTLIVGLIAFGFAAVASPAEARDRHHGSHHHHGGHCYHGRWIVGRPYSGYQPHYYHNDYYRSPYYGYGWPYRPYYGYGPGITFSFGGHSHGHHYRR